MSTTASRALRLLSLLQTGGRHSARELAEVLGVRDRTVRRDVRNLRELGYRVTSSAGRLATYRLEGSDCLPPLLLDADQAVAISLALQTSPVSVLGLREATGRALATLTQVMDATLTARIDATRLTLISDYWEFPAPPLSPALLAEVGSAVRHRRMIRVEGLRPDGTRPHPRDEDFSAPVRAEPHHLVLWAGRWYLVVFLPDEGRWRVLRVDQVKVDVLSTSAVPERPLPSDSVRDLVMDEPDRGDVPAAWPCRGSAVLALPPHLVARYSPGGSVVTRLDEHRTRVTLGAWSWAGIVGILLTFGAPISDVEPPELRQAFVDASRRAGDAAAGPRA